MFTIAICDDMKEIQKEIESYIDKAFCNNEEYEILKFSSGEELLSWLDSNDKNIELLFLDIEMPGKNGVEIKSLLGKNEKVKRLVFATSHFENMQEAFGVKVIGFMLKPLNYGEVSRRVKNAYNEYVSDTVVEIAADVFVKKSEISYIKSEGNYCDFYGINGSVIKAIRNPLRYYKKMFGESFLQIHRSFIVNAYDIKKSERNSVMLSNNAELTIGRSYVESFRKEYRAIAMKNAHEKL